VEELDSLKQQLDLLLQTTETIETNETSIHAEVSVSTSLLDIPEANLTVTHEEPVTEEKEIVTKETVIEAEVTSYTADAEHNTTIVTTEKILETSVVNETHAETQTTVDTIVEEAAGDIQATIEGSVETHVVSETITTTTVEDDITVAGARTSTLTVDVEAGSGVIDVSGEV